MKQLPSLQSLKNTQQIAVFIPKKPFFGAMMVQFPFFLLLRKNFPEARICICANYDGAKLFLTYDLADEVKYYGRKVSKKNSIVRELRRLKPDILINLRYRSEKTHLYSSLISSKVKVGFTPKNSLYNSIYQFTAPFLYTQYIALNYLDVLKGLGVDTQNSFLLFQALSSKAIPFQNRGKEYKNLVTFMPGGGEGEYKRWGIENFCELGKILIKEHNAHLVFVLGNQEKDLVDKIKGDFHHSDSTILVSASVYDIIDITLKSNVVVANDCGPSHIAQIGLANYMSIWGWLEERNPLEILGLWFLPTKNSLAIVPPYPQKDIKKITSDQVYKYAKVFLKPK